MTLPTKRRRKIAADGGVASNLAYRKQLSKRCKSHEGNWFYWIAIGMMVVFIFGGIH